MVNATEEMERNMVVATPWKETTSPAGQAAVTTATRLAPMETPHRRATEFAGVAHRATEDPSVERHGVAEVGHSAPSFDQGQMLVRVLQPVVTEKALPRGLPSLGMDKVMLEPSAPISAADSMTVGEQLVDATEDGPFVPSDGTNPVAAVEPKRQQMLELATNPEGGPPVCQAVATNTTTPDSDGWAPISDLVTTRATQEGGDMILDVVGAGQNTSTDREPVGATANVTTYECMHPSRPHAVETDGQHQGNGLTSKEQIAQHNIRSFCTGLLKKLAPPLLKEFEGLGGVKAGQDPFTPRRATRSISLGGNSKSKASAAEAVLVKALASTVMM
ncbi:hypothetical protein ZWY2020_052714 [Hordeum vulgare]|nr:hypothetical protein ZWY2020_052714 [Hordeum vulgare]